jgi:ParB family chromosome partitioning protein
MALVDPDPAGRGMVELPVERVVANPRQPRSAFEAGALEGLARSIATDGVLQPIVVRDRGDGKYELIAGERRLRAARQAGLTAVPALIRRADEKDSLLLALVENVAREDLNAIDEARAYAALVDGFGLSVAEVATRVGRSRPTVANTLRLLDLPDDVLEHIAEGRLSEGHGRALLQAEGHDAQRSLAKRAVAEGWSVRRAEAAAREQKPAVRAPAAPRAATWIHDDLVNDLTDAVYRALGVPARVKADGDGCRVELLVEGPQALSALLERLEQRAAAGDG